MRAEDFSDFYEAVHGHAPFPWQRDLVQEVASRGQWPALVDVPTGLGKTAMLDIAVFMAAWDADAPPSERVGRRRIFFVVDRRIVVDQAHDHASKVARALREASRDGDGILSQVGRRLQHLGHLPDPGAEILPVVKMRGGVTWDAAWLTRPDLPGVITGTVDQIGSRLLFRGYGVSSRRWPIDAALVGTDSLVLIDEAHLASALTTTLDAAREYDATTTALPLVAPVMVQMSATAQRGASGWVPAFDEAAHLANPTARQRLQAPKLLHTDETTKAKAPQHIAAAAAEIASQHDSSRVLVVCNTIDRARAVHAELAKRLPADTWLGLLMGRSRPCDREPVIAGTLEWFMADQSTSASGRAVLVATQTVEVGIDLDASALITESASWDALVQRIGRVNRRGERAAAPVLVIHDGDPKNPVYGAAREAAMAYLLSLDPEGRGVDVSPEALRRLDPPEDSRLAPPDVPYLMPSQLDAWARTAPPPTNDPPVEPYLHGFDQGLAPVTMLWRDGLWAADDARLPANEIAMLLEAVPPRAEETIEVPLGAVRRWLAEQKSEPLGEWDDETDWDVPFGDDDASRVVRRALNADGSTTWGWAGPGELRPGDMIVVPSELGGLDTYGWAPSNEGRVVDISELASLERGRPLLRLDPDLPHRLGLAPPDPELWARVMDWGTADTPDNADHVAKTIRDRVRDWLATADVVRPAPWGDERLARLAATLADATVQPVVTSHRGADAPPAVEPSPIVVLRAKGSAAWRDAQEESPDGTVHLARPVLLKNHHADVGARAEEIAERMGLPDNLARVVVDAARWHDLGKVDPRFQADLFGGDPIQALLADEPRAKSGMAPGDVQLRQDARRRSGLPARARHEAWSAALVSAHLAANTTAYEGDQELLVHLVASHHGYARPLLPIVLDEAEHDLEAEVDGQRVTAALPKTVDLMAAERFRTLNARYGRWGLAMLETIVRCADVTVSGEGR